MALTASVLYLELVFKASTTGHFFPQVLPIVAFSISIGQALQLLCSLSRHPRANRVLKLTTLVTLGVLFCAEYFVYRQFKLCYDPITVLAGAGDVAGQFGGTVRNLVLSPDGILHIALFLAPALAYALIGCGRKLDPAERYDSTSRILGGCTVAGTYLLAIFLLACLPPLGSLYTTHYSFQNGVQSFGLLTSLRKEAQLAAFGKGRTFEPEVEEPPTQAAERDEHETDDAKTERKAKTEKPREYPPAVLDIDFDALAESTDGTWADLDRYVASVTPSRQNEYTGIFEGYNLIFISAEAFSAEAIRPDTTPTLYKMWKHGIQLTDYYQFDTAGTTGGECANLFGLLATEGGSSVKMTADHNNYLTMGNLLNRRGYNGWAFHNNTYTYYGRDTTHFNLGYNNGYVGYGNGMEQWVTWQWPQSDLEMVQGTFDNLYGKASPFNVYYMSVSGHSDYDLGENMMAVKNWDVVEGLPYSDRVKGYLGANVELDRAMEYLLARLKEEGIYRKTVIVISADHFPYGLDDDAPLGQLPYLSELYGYEVQNIFQRDHNLPIIWCGQLAKRPEPIVIDTPTMSIDLLPTLCNLFGVEWDSRLLPGRDVLDPGTEGIAFNLDYDWRTSLGTYWASSGSFEPNDGVEVPDGYVDQHNAMVANKIGYCRGVLTTDYYRHVFGEPEDVVAVHDAAVTGS
ncbi:MAG: LTA synthase family protein [Atopobiaceae bacterium]|nr:LTA synthase family protein [Atopobiaceae bacterium]